MVIFTLHRGTPSSLYSTDHIAGAQCSKITEVTLTKDMENPPNARHWYEHVPRGPKRSLEIPPSEARIQMVRLNIFNK
jgi:hypothetical protein